MAFLGAEFPVNATTAGDQLLSSQTVLEDGRVLVTWVSTETGGQPYDIRGRILSAEGTPTASDFVINTVPLGDAGQPSVTALANGGAFVAWQSYMPDVNAYEIRGSIVGADGTSGADFLVSHASASSPSMPSAAVLADGRILVAYTSDDGEPRYPGDIRGRMLNADGTPATDDDFLITSAWGTQFDPQVAALPDGRALVTWTSYDPNEGRYNISGIFVNGDGSPNWPEFRVLPGVQRDQMDAAITVLANGHIMVTWAEQEIDGDRNIHGRIMDADGRVIATDIIINATLEADQLAPTVTALPDGRALVAWRAINPDTGASELYGRIVEPGGLAVGPDFIINEENGLTESAPRLSTLPDGRVLATWTSFDPASTSSDIHGRLLAFNTITDGTPDDDRIIGTTDNDVIAGQSGRDIVFGGPANDALHGHTGNDLLFGEAGNDFLYGGDGDDLLWGNKGNDILTGGRGADNHAGAAGRDTVRYESSPASINVDLALGVATGGDAEGDRFTSIEVVIASRFRDTVIGDTADNRLSGGGGRDVLDGREGDDVLDGGEGIDDLVGREGNDVVRGGPGDDRLWGNAGDDSLDGGAGADVFSGGAGVDTADYSALTIDVNVNLAAASGQWGADGDTYNSIENVIGTAVSDLLTGDAGANHLAGGGGNDWLDGGGERDLLEGGDGDDLLRGGSGADVLSGGAGADVFFFYEAQHSPTGSPDQIMDFSDLDLLSLSMIDANSQRADDQAFSYIGSAAFTNAAGELRFAEHLLEGDIDGDGTADFQIDVNVATLTSGDFLL